MDTQCTADIQCIDDWNRRKLLVETMLVHQMTDCPPITGRLGLHRLYHTLRICARHWPLVQRELPELALQIQMTLWSKSNPFRKDFIQWFGDNNWIVRLETKRRLLQHKVDCDSASIVDKYLAYPTEVGAYLQSNLCPQLPTWSKSTLSRRIAHIDSRH